MPPSGRSSGSRFAFLGQGRGAGQGRGGMVAGQGGAGQGWEQGSARGRAGRGQGRDGGINWEDSNTHANCLSVECSCQLVKCQTLMPIR